MLAISPAQVTVNPSPPIKMICVIGVFDGVGTERRKLRLNCVQPRGIRWCVDRLHVMPGKEGFGSTHIGREIVHHDINAQLHRIASPQAFETRRNVNTCFAFADTANQAVAMHIIKAMQLFDTAFARIGRPMPLGMPMACPTRTRDGT